MPGIGMSHGQGMRLDPCLDNWYLTKTHYAKCDIISRQKETFIQTEIFHQQSSVIQKYKRTCTTILKVLSHNAIKKFVS